MEKPNFCTNWIWDGMQSRHDKRFDEWVRYKRIARFLSFPGNGTSFFLCKNECIAHELCIWWNTGSSYYSIVKAPLEKNSLRPAARRSTIGRSVAEISIQGDDIPHIGR